MSPTPLQAYPGLILKAPPCAGDRTAKSLTWRHCEASRALQLRRVGASQAAGSHAGGRASDGEGHRRVRESYLETDLQNNGRARGLGGSAWSGERGEGTLSAKRASQDPVPPPPPLSLPRCDCK